MSLPFWANCTVVTTLGWPSFMNANPCMQTFFNGEQR